MAALRGDENLNPLYFLAAQRWHEVSHRGPWEIERMVEELQAQLFHSTVVDRAVRPLPCNPRIESVAFHLGEQVFARVVRQDGNDAIIRVWADTLDKADATFRDLRMLYAMKKRRRHAPGSFSFLSVKRGKVEAVTVDINRSRRMTKPDLALHYGCDFLDWEAGFLRRLQGYPTGLSIFRGEPGTGKTSYIRHLIAKHQRILRFYYIPVSQFSMLASLHLVEFWLEEKRSWLNKRAARTTRVLIVEDAELLVAERAADNLEAVSNLLNIADGLLGELLSVHVLCTMNRPIEQIDSAITRPGRLLALREFRRLNFTEATALAQKKGIFLPEERDYSLAEIYNYGRTANAAEHPAPRHIGFAA